MDHNISNVIRLSGIVILITLITSCVSIRELPGPRSAEDTLVVTPVVIIDGRETAFTGTVLYEIALENIDNGKNEYISLSTDYNGYTYTRGIPEGTYEVRGYRTRRIKDDSPYRLSFDSLLVVKQGAFSVFPAKLVVYVYTDPIINNYSYIYSHFEELDEDHKNRIMDLLSTHEEFVNWNK